MEKELPTTTSLWKKMNLRRTLELVRNIGRLVEIRRKIVNDEDLAARIFSKKNLLRH